MAVLGPAPTSSGVGLPFSFSGVVSFMVIPSPIFQLVLNGIKELSNGI
jgi:hypothetical protein